MLGERAIPSAEHQENIDAAFHVSDSIHIDEEDEDEEECRVCRGPAEEGRPLYTPCRCSGSIGCTHQDCLVSWLEVTRGVKCELCSTQFKFAPKYAEDTPVELPPLEVVTGVLHRAGKKWVPFILRIVLAAALWLCVLPLATAYLYFGWLHRPSSLVTRLKFEHIAGDTVSGALVATVIVVSFLSLMSFADFLRIHWQQVNQRRANDVHEVNEVEDEIAEDDIQFVGENDGELAGENAQQPIDNDDDLMGGEDELMDDEEDVPEVPAQGLHRLLRPQRPNDEDEGDIPEEHEVDADGLHFRLEVERERNGMLEEGEENAQELGDRAHDVEQDEIHFLREPADIDQEEEDEEIEHIFDRPIPNDALLNEPFRNVDARAEPRLDLAADQDDAMEMEIHMALDELLGIRGPLPALFRNLMWLLAFNTTYLGLFAFIPHTVGISVNAALTNSSVIAFLSRYLFRSGSLLESSLTAIVALNTESRRLNTLLQLPDLATIVLGYLSMACMVFLWQGATSVVLRIIKCVAQRRNQTATSSSPDRNSDFHLNRAGVDELRRAEGIVRGRIPHRLSVVLECAAAIVKVGILLFLKMLLLPLLLGVWLDTATLSLFDSTLANRILFAGTDLFSSLLLHWVAGITFMLLVTVSVLQLREVVHPELLAKAIRPQEPQPDLLGNLLQESGLTHAKRMLVSLGIYALLLSIHIWLPSYILVSTGVGSILPLFQPHINYLFLPKLQIPIELLIFHLSVLAFLEKYKNQIGNLQHQFLLFICEKMDITDHIVPRTVDKFIFVGSRPVYKESVSRSTSSNLLSNTDEDADLSDEIDDKKTSKEEVSKSGKVVDSFWKDLSHKSYPAEDYIINNINLVNSSLPPTFEAGVTKRGGQRSLGSSPAVISINISSVESIKLTSNTGGHRLRRTRKDNEDVIECWREVPGSTINRPPDGWDDLGVGGAEIQGRWAWGNEKRSEIEAGVAYRKQFKESKEFSLLMFKLLFLLFASWIAVFVIVCIGLNTPLIVGRMFLHLLQIPDHYKHDPNGTVIGLAALYLLSRLALKGSSDQMSIYKTKVRSWITSYTPPTSKSKMSTLLFTMVLWFIVSPTFLGIMYDMCFVMAHNRWTGEVALFSLKSCFKGWLSGLLILHVWAVMSYFGAFSRNFWQSLIMNMNENNNEQEENEANGNINEIQNWQGKDGIIYNFTNTLVSVFSGWEWDKVDSSVLLKSCMLPLVKELGLLFCCSLFTFSVQSYIFPYVSSTSFLSNILPSLSDVGNYRRIAFLLCTLFVITTRLCFSCHTMLHHWFKAAHKAARDDRYLIGEELLDFTS